MCRLCKIRIVYRLYSFSSAFSATIVCPSPIDITRVCFITLRLNKNSMILLSGSSPIMNKAGVILSSCLNTSNMLKSAEVNNYSNPSFAMNLSRISPKRSGRSIRVNIRQENGVSRRSTSNGFSAFTIEL
jgi:hypothetical protein